MEPETSQSVDVEQLAISAAIEGEAMGATVPVPETGRPHSDKLAGLLANPKLPVVDQPRIEAAIARYQEWVRAMDALPSAGEERVRDLVCLLNDYKFYMGHSATDHQAASALLANFPLLPIDRQTIAQKCLNLVTRTRTSVLPWRGQFSPELIDVFLRAYAPPGAAVLDPFVGSGTTLIECGRRDHPAFGIDVNPAAIYSARTAELMTLPSALRQTLFDEMERLLLADLSSFRTPDLFTTVATGGDPNTDVSRRVTTLFATHGQSRHARTILGNVLMQAMGDTGTTATADQLVRAFYDYRAACLHLPYSARPLLAWEGDARSVPLSSGTIDLIVTSPPYINVFNYHQNYRKAMERLGFTPLAAARSEVGANRKHRQNRFLTVVQYCIDMLDALTEAHRLLRPNGTAIIVVGRESNVLGQVFENGRAVYSLAVGGAGFRLACRHERVFVSRFGSRVYEDILVLITDETAPVRASGFARRVAEQLLTWAAIQAPAAARQSINAALEQIEEVAPSPYRQEPKRDEQPLLIG